MSAGDYVDQMSQIMNDLCDVAATKTRTSKLWIQYYRQVSLMRLFIRAERLGDWELHLYCIKEMLPYFHAAGHLAYAKSAQLYIQQMMELPQTMPATDYKQFTENGYFTIRRFNRFWDGVFSDQTIEQFLMRMFQTAGGMTHGRGITESTLSKWVHAMPRCIPICNALEDFTAVHTSTSEQHKDLRASTEMRDNSDTIRFEQWLHVHSPFKEQVTDDLVSLVNGVVADGSVNCDDAIISIGQRARSKMIGHPYGDITLHRKDKVNSLGSMKNTIKVRGEVVVNHDVLFNRITCVLNTSSELDNFIQYELAPQLPSLCVDGQMRKGTKSALGKSLKALVTCQKVAPDDAEYVVDGGHLLHAIIWSKPATYKDICEAYRDFVIQYSHVTIVFDGDEGPPSTKSAEHDRRARLEPQLTSSLIHPCQPQHHKRTF